MDFSVAAALSGLTLGADYHFRLVATNAAGTSRSVDDTFRAGLPGVWMYDFEVTSPTAAVFTGAVEPNGGATSYHFEYGTTSAYGTSTPTRSAGSGSGQVDISEPVSGLVAGTRYYARLAATNAQGTTYGQDDFSFVAGVASAYTQDVYPLGVTTATLNGVISAHGSAASYHFEYGTDEQNLTASTPTQPIAGSAVEQAVSAPLTGLTQGQRYYFRLVVVNAYASTSAYGESFVTGTPSVQDLSAELTGASTATIAGSLNPHGLATSYHLQYGPTSAYGSTTPTTSAGAGEEPFAVSVPLTGLTPGQTYHVQLVVTNAAGTIESSALTFVAGVPRATFYSVTDLTATSATFIGSVKAAGQSTTYRFEYGPTEAYGQLTPEQDAGSGTAENDVTALVSGLTTGTTYHVRLVATNGSGTMASEDFEFTATAAPAAHDSGENVTSPTTVTLYGDVDPHGLDTDYHFEYGPTPDYGTSTPVSTVSAGANFHDVSAELSGLTTGATYYYRVVVSNTAGTSSSPGGSFAVLARPRTVADEPTGVSATAAQLHGHLDT